MIKAICFDLDGVYFTSNGFSSFKKAIETLGVEYKDIEYILHKKPMLQFKKGEIDEETFWKNAVDYWKIDKSPQELINLLPQGYEINPEVDSLVHTVRKNGYKTCICSNNFTTRIKKLEEKFNFLKDFDAYVFSYEVGVTKPNREIFEELVKRAEVNPNELVYSDDSEDKLKGALELGINAFVYESFDQFKKELVNLGVTL